MTISIARKYLRPYRCYIMNRKEARKLASDTVVWFFENNLKQATDNYLFTKKSDRKPKMSDAMWAKLMTEAILSFHEGLNIEPEGNRVANESYLYNSVVDFVGEDAFKDIAFIVSAAGARRPIEQEIEQSFKTMQQQPGEATGFTGPEGLAGLIATNEDAKAYGSASTIIMQIESSPPEQGLYHQSAQQLQQISKTPGLSQPFARALASLGAEYMSMADELTRQSGEGRQPGMAGPGISGLPTGVHIGHRLRLIALRKRIIKEAKEAA